MKRRVVDASSGVKWAIEEVHCEQARVLLDGSYALLATDLFFPEVGNILWKKARRGEMAAGEVGAVFHAIGSVRMEVFPSPPLMPLALEIAVRTGRSVYDSLYVALAVREGAPLVTADERLFNALASGPLSSAVEWIEDL
jgi:predicted nucleic acid-binding protein